MTLPTKRTSDTPSSPIPGVLPESVRIQHERAVADQRPAHSDPARAERATSAARRPQSVPAS